jgi:hypothetical protein
VQPEKLNSRLPRVDFLWQGKRYWLSDGWLFFKHDWTAVDYEAESIGYKKRPKD